MSEAAFELGGKQAKLIGAFGVEQVGDRFGLGEVELAAYKGTFGEFAGQCRLCAGFEQSAEYETCADRAAVAADLDGIFAGIGMRRTEHGGKAGIDFFAVGGKGCAERGIARGKLG